MAELFAPVSWSYATNIYEVNLRQYTYDGSFNAFALELPRLKDMGIEILWFMPITPISIEKRKGTLGSYYACSDYTATNPEFGSMDDFKSLVRQAQQLNMKVIIDWVANHTGWDHRWTIEHPDYYAHDESNNFTERNGWDDVIDLNFSNNAMRSALIGAMEFWVTECGIDGFRCDMAHLVPLDFWRQARTALTSIKELFWLAETEEIDFHQVFDTTYTWEWMHTTEKFSRNEINAHGLLAQLMTYNNQFPATAFRAYFTSNHDENSWNGTEYEKYGSAALNLAVFSCTWNGIPLIYSGQELPNLKRLKFFDKDAIEWTDTCALHDFYKTLLALRKRNKALRAGDNDVHTYSLDANSNDRIFCFLRKHPQNEVLVLLNFTSEPIRVPITHAMINGVYTDVFTKGSFDSIHEREVDVPAWSFRVFEK